MLSESIERAFAIEPAPGTTFMDAEHVVILMQENRSFDHLYGSLRGIRGFDDPRALQLPNGNPVWFQSNKQGETFAPFRLDIKNTKVTWLGSLPHSWTNQTDARNHGKHDGWLEAKRSGHKECVGMPFTMGAYTREDVPFYYDLADAFTVCDQHFCSSLTGTMPNRLYLWSGTIRGVRDASARARVNNEDIEYENSCTWKTFPERLEELGVSWKVYQNEISAVDVGLTSGEAAWLANYGDNPLEWFPQFNVGFSTTHRAQLDHLAATLPAEIAKLRTEVETEPASVDLKKRLKKKETLLKTVTERRFRFTEEKFAKLTAWEKALFSKALSTNSGDPDYRKLAELRYQDGPSQRTMRIPKGDVLHQFRQDVTTGKLPTVSWIVAPENLSDHPSSAWYGAWYVSELMNILTQNPEVWRKTVFILTYDENDGYFDHVPPFVAPHPHKPETGAIAGGVKSDEDFVTMEEELKTKTTHAARESSIGLGFRVPLVIASPWSRGGYVCSEVFDHTSSLQFLEKLLSHKLGKAVREPNISDWRRTVCGDLTSSFRPYHGEAIPLPPFLKREPFVESIHRAQFKPLPTDFNALSEDHLRRLREGTLGPFGIRQEPGTRPSCPLPYELSVNAAIHPKTNRFEITFAAKTDRFGKRSAGAAFNVYAPRGHRSLTDGSAMEMCRSWNFAVPSGSTLKYAWNPEDFADGNVLLRVYGPNGFFREFRSDSNPPVTIRSGYRQSNVLLDVINTTAKHDKVIEIVDKGYGAPKRTKTIPAGGKCTVSVDTAATLGWHDFTVAVVGNSSFEMRLAGRIETGRESISDPQIGRAS